MTAIVLVGGSFLGAWAWERVTPQLREHDLYPVTLTGAGDRYHLDHRRDTTLAVNADDIVHAIEYADLADLVLVAHSYGAAPATIAAARIPERIRRLVYVGGVLPIPEKTLFEVAGPDIEAAIRSTVVDEQIPVTNDFFLDLAFGDHGLGPDDKAYLRARGTAQPIGTYTDPAPADLSGAEGIDRVYVVCSGDPGEPPVTDGTPGWEFDRIESGHWPMITAPDRLITVLNRWL